jgi:hypothetical protein
MRLALLLALFAVLLPVGAVASNARAHVGFASLSPVSVRGGGFKSGERVTLTVSAKATHKKAVTANARGAFRATFKGFSIGRCQAFGVVAKGNRGSTAAAKLIPECAPPAVPGPSDPLLPNDPHKKP